MWLLTDDGESWKNWWAAFQVKLPTETHPQSAKARESQRGGHVWAVQLTRLKAGWWPGRMFLAGGTAERLGSWAHGGEGGEPDRAVWRTLTDHHWSPLSLRVFVHKMKQFQVSQILQVTFAHIAVCLKSKCILWWTTPCVCCTRAPVHDCHVGTEDLTGRQKESTSCGIWHTVGAQSILKEINSEYSLQGLMLGLKLQYFGHPVRRADSWEKTLMLEEIEGRRRRGRQDEMVGWYHWLNACEFEQTQGDGEGQGGLACCSPWGRKESDTTEQLNNKVVQAQSWTHHPLVPSNRRPVYLSKFFLVWRPCTHASIPSCLPCHLSWIPGRYLFSL